MSDRDRMLAEVYLKVHPTPHEAIAEPIIDALLAAGVTMPAPRGVAIPGACNRLVVQATAHHCLRAAGHAEGECW